MESVSHLLSQLVSVKTQSAKCMQERKGFCLVLIESEKGELRKNIHFYAV
jgi:hypothetical protein